jgi:hypothetical protein
LFYGHGPGSGQVGQPGTRRVTERSGVRSNPITRSIPVNPAVLIQNPSVQAIEVKRRQLGSKEMRFAYPSQRIQDWLSQQWVIFRGQRIDPDKIPWLMGPFGNVDAIGDDFIGKLASDENLTIERDVKAGGILASMRDLGLEQSDYDRLSKAVIDFYENTAKYDLDLWVEWNMFFRPFGGLVHRLYSRRLEQLNLPLKPLEVSRGVRSEVVTLREKTSGDVRYTIWYRVLKSSGRVIYSGVYTTCTLPDGRICIKAVFPLPRGNATVIMSPAVGADGALELTSSGSAFGDPGFYFLLNDSKGGYWAQYLRTFREKLTVFVDEENQLRAEHVLSVWKRRALEVHYRMTPSVAATESKKLPSHEVNALCNESE